MQTMRGRRHDRECQLVYPDDFAINVNYSQNYGFLPLNNDYVFSKKTNGLCNEMPCSAVYPIDNLMRIILTLVAAFAGLYQRSISFPNVSSRVVRRSGDGGLSQTQVGQYHDNSNFFNIIELYQP